MSHAPPHFYKKILIPSFYDFSTLWSFYQTSGISNYVYVAFAYY